MQIHRFFITTQPVDSIGADRVFVFREDVSLISEGDAIVARIGDGQEELFIVTKATGDDWDVVRGHGDQHDLEGAPLHLTRVDDFRLRVLGA